MKNLSHMVRILIRIVAVAHIVIRISTGISIRRAAYSVGIVNSGSPASNGTPKGILLMATIIELVTIITLQRIENPIDKNTR